MARVRKNSPVGMIVGGICFMLVAAIVFTMGQREKAMQKRCTEETSATITSVDRQTRSKKSGKHRHYYYVYKSGYIFDVGSTSYSGSTTLKSSPTIGESIAVYYNPNDPDENYTDNDKVDYASFFVPILFGVLGLMFFITGIKEGKEERSYGGNYRNSGIGGAVVGAALSDRNNNYNSYNNNNYYGRVNSYNSYDQNGFNGNNGYNGYNNQNGFGGNNGYNSYNNQNGFGGNNGYNGYNNQNGFGGNNGYNSYNNQNSFDGSNGYNNGYNNNYNGGYNDSDFNQLN
ncbi:DUF3592 domain-containing protein [Ruminococcus albus]|uniref:DUF3592 domain-containing protein n=1 Tax=Ruminococcus albus 8 TaxID=246199 RepID=E9SE93_RUMAL|nr:DUF3592 domain-containing protein [Ruminococcus albus]EGC02348.1 hypothetical protein CUS_6003 [Ruminococcus albus 8]MCC3351178.1 DUF3592 domain-containing protein [Ruminococcus albus 8]